MNSRFYPEESQQMDRHTGKFTNISIVKEETAPIEESDNAEHEDKEDERNGESSVSEGVAQWSGEHRPEGNHEGDVAVIVGKKK